MDSVKISFTKQQLKDPEFSTQREVIRTNRAGAYLSTTISGMNTRKYHGLLVVPVEQFGGEKHVLLSSVDETIVYGNTEFPLATRKYENEFTEPQGYRYLDSVEFGKVPAYTYRAGGVKLSYERLLVENEQQVLIRYTLEDAPADVVLRLRPFMAFRNIHSLSKVNPWAQTGIEETDQGIRIRLYDYYPWLHLQLSKNAEFKPAPDWYYNVGYDREKERGYDYMEDLFSPGTIETVLRKGESVVFSAGVKKAEVSGLKKRFYHELRKRFEKKDLQEFLRNAATQFTWHKGGQEDITAGFPWYDSISRQTFISLPGLRLTQSDRKLGMAVLDTYLPHLKGGLFPRSISSPDQIYDGADTSLWFIWSLQQLRKQGCRIKDLGVRYGDAVKEILDTYRHGTTIVNMLENGLLFAADQGKAYTWMDSYAWGNPAVPRYGMPVELNALWYNAIRFALEMAGRAGDSEFVERWNHMPEMIEESFLNAFWDEEKGYLADVYNGFYTDWSVRPNMVIAASMDYTPLSLDQQHAILEKAEKYLVTPKGLRTLSPEDPAYSPVVTGLPDERENAMHKGAVHPWLIMFYTDIVLRIRKKTGIADLRRFLDGFSEELSQHCLGTISEVYDGEPPYHARGALSQAWNVAALLASLHKLSLAEK
jgi:predicted glycogen debranching enzyme